MATTSIPMQPIEEKSPSPQPVGERRPPPSLTSRAYSQQSIKSVTLVVYTMKEGESAQLRFPTGRFTTAEQVQLQMLQSMGLPAENANIFSLWLASRHLQLQLKAYHLPCKIFRRWKDLLSQYTNASYEDVCADEPILFLRRNAFFPLREEKKLIEQEVDRNRKTIDLLYHEAASNVIRSHYPVTKPDLHLLAGLQASVFAAETNVNADLANLRPFLTRFYPQYKTSTKRVVGRLFKQASQRGSLQASFVRALESAQSKVTDSRDPHQLKVLYLQLCWSNPYYGSVMFHGQIQRPFNPVHILAYSDKRVTVAINTECLHIFDTQTPPEIMLFLTYDQLSWDLQLVKDDKGEDKGEDCYSTLWLEFDSVIKTGGEERRVSKRVQIFSRQAPMMDAMITRCVADIEKRERETLERRAEQRVEAVAEVKTPSLGKNYKEDKLMCSIWSQEGRTLSRGFTLTRVLSKQDSRKQLPRAVSPSSTVSQSEPVSPRRESDAPTQQSDTQSASSAAQLISNEPVPPPQGSDASSQLLQYPGNNQSTGSTTQLLSSET